jgi:hypothetical protein
MVNWQRNDGVKKITNGAIKRKGCAYFAINRKHETNSLWINAVAGALCDERAKKDGRAYL